MLAEVVEESEGQGVEVEELVWLVELSVDEVDELVVVEDPGQGL